MFCDRHKEIHEIGLGEGAEHRSQRHDLRRTALLQQRDSLGDEVQRLAQKRIDDDALLALNLDRHAKTQNSTSVSNCFSFFCSSSRIATKLRGELTNVGSVAMDADLGLFCSFSFVEKRTDFGDRLNLRILFGFPLPRTHANECCHRRALIHTQIITDDDLRRLYEAVKTKDISKLTSKQRLIYSFYLRSNVEMGGAALF